MCTFAGCNKTFGRNEERTRHEKIHLGLKPFICEKVGVFMLRNRTMHSIRQKNVDKEKG